MLSFLCVIYFINKIPFILFSFNIKWKICCFTVEVFFIEFYDWNEFLILMWGFEGSSSFNIILLNRVCKPFSTSPILLPQFSHFNTLIKIDRKFIKFTLVTPTKNLMTKIHQIPFRSTNLSSEKIKKFLPEQFINRQLCH